MNQIQKSTYLNQRRSRVMINFAFDLENVGTSAGWHIHLGAETREAVSGVVLTNIGSKILRFVTIAS